MRETINTNGFWIGEIINRHKNGTIVNEHLTIQTVVDEKGEIEYYIASFLDITSQKKTEIKLQEKETLLTHQSKMAAMGEMLENIIHQWRQPLSLISTTATSMAVTKEFDMPVSKEEEIEGLNNINDTVQHLSQTVEDFRNFFKPDKEQKQFKILDTYKKTLKLSNSKFKSLSIELVEDIDDTEIISLENELIQVIMNILNNARDILQTKENQKRLIFIKVYKENNYAVISLKDNAGGIPEGIIEKIFLPYFTTKEESNGTGIGLHMSEEMVTKHMNGKLTVTNDTFKYNDILYKGANFKIELPI